MNRLCSKVWLAVFVHDRLPFLRACLASLEAYLPRWVDVALYCDAPSPEIMDFVRSVSIRGRAPEVHHSTEPTKVAFQQHRAFDEFLGRSEYDCLGVLASDMIIGQGAVQKMRLILTHWWTRDRRIGFLSGGRSRIPLYEGRRWRLLDDRGSGAFALIPREALEQVGNCVRTRGPFAMLPVGHAMRRKGVTRAVPIYPTVPVQHIGGFRNGVSVWTPVEESMFTDCRGGWVNPSGLCDWDAFRRDPDAAADALADRLLSRTCCTGAGRRESLRAT